MNNAAVGRREVKNAGKQIRRCFLLAAALAVGSLARPLFAQLEGPPQVVEEATLEVFVSDDFGIGASQTVYRLRTSSGESLELHPLFGAELPTRTGARVRVTGHREAGMFAADRVESLSSAEEDRAA